MALNLRGLRIYALGLARRAVRDIRRDNFRQLRNYVDMCALLSKGKGHRLFFERAQGVLEQSDSLYYPLIQRVIATVSEDALCIFGVNVGIDMLTTGAGQIQRLAAAGAQRVPWISLADAGAALDDAVAEGEKNGLYGWCLFARGEADALQGAALAGRHSKCAFTLLLPPAAVTEALVRLLQQTPNLAVDVTLDSPELSEDAHAALQRLREAKLLYGVSLDLDDATVQQVLNREWVDVMAQHTLFCVLSHTRMSSAAAQALAQQVYRLRLSSGAPLLPFIWEEDIAYISNAISPAACVQDLRAGKQPG